MVPSRRRACRRSRAIDMRSSSEALTIARHGLRSQDRCGPDADAQGHAAADSGEPPLRNPRPWQLTRMARLPDALRTPIASAASQSTTEMTASPSSLCPHRSCQAMLPVAEGVDYVDYITNKERLPIDRLPIALSRLRHKLLSRQAIDRAPPDASLFQRTAYYHAVGN